MYEEGDEQEYLLILGRSSKRKRKRVGGRRNKSRDGLTPESITTLMGVAPSVKVFGAPPDVVPVIPSKVRVKSTTPVKPSNPEGTRSIVTSFPINLSVSMPPKSRVPAEDLSSFVHRLNALEAI